MDGSGSATMDGDTSTTSTTNMGTSMSGSDAGDASSSTSVTASTTSTTDSDTGTTSGPATSTGVADTETTGETGDGDEFHFWCASNYGTVVLFDRIADTFNETPVAAIEFYDIALGNGLAVAGGLGGSVVIEDLVVTPGSTENFEWLTFGDGTFVGADYDSFASYEVRVSTDGLIWTTSTQSVGEAVTFGGGRFVAAGSDGAMGWSTDGMTWNLASTDVGLSFGNTDITYGDGAFVMVGAQGRVARSLDGGESWTEQNVGVHLRAVAHGGGRFVAAGDNGAVLYSEDSMSWTPVANVAPTSTIFLELAYNEELGEFLLAGRDGVGWNSVLLSSVDGGETWQAVTFPVMQDRLCWALAAAG